MIDLIDDIYDGILLLGQGNQCLHRIRLTTTFVRQIIW